MPNVQIIEEKNAVLVPIKDWDRLQRQVDRLKKKVRTTEMLNDLRATLIEIETEIRSGRTPKGRDADEFLAELRNEK